MSCKILLVNIPKSIGCCELVQLRDELAGGDQVDFEYPMEVIAINWYRCT
jgi:hypothetical protein